ncbi:MAG: hypothetical protein H0V17_04950 [Deltaproteobacteria bacterium]|nr:hypothetical protein [Deltaproteobacteria bacterium]
MKSVVAVLVLIPALAHADPVRIATAMDDEPPVAPPGMTPVLEVPSEIDQPVRPLTAIEEQRGVVASNRHFLTGTALTVPEGRVELTGRSAILVNGVGIAAGVTSTTEIWADAYGAEDDFTIYGAGIKQVLGRGRNWQLAATASIHGGSDGGSDERIASVGGLLTACTDNCAIMATAGVLLLMAEDDDAIPVFTGGISIGRATTRLVSEVAFANEGGEGGGVGFLGIRFGSRKVNCDLGLAMPLADGDEGALPMVAVAGRL